MPKIKIKSSDIQKKSE